MSQTGGDDRQKDLLRPEALDEIVDLNGHPLARLSGAGSIGLPRPALRLGLSGRSRSARLADAAGRRALHPEAHAQPVGRSASARWLENPYYQFFCGELSFCRQAAVAPTACSLTRWRQRLGEEQLVALIPESLSAGAQDGCDRDIGTWSGSSWTRRCNPRRSPIRPDARPDASGPGEAGSPRPAGRGSASSELCPGRQARGNHDQGRYTHAHQFKRMRRELKFLRIRLGRVIRDIRRKIAGRPDLFGRASTRCSISQPRSAFSRSPPTRPGRSFRCTPPKSSAHRQRKGPRTLRVRLQSERVATPVTSPKGGQFVLHAKALHGNPFDGHTLGPMVADFEKLTGGPGAPHPRRQRLSRPQANANKLRASGSAARSVVPPRPYAAR